MRDLSALVRLLCLCTLVVSSAAAQEPASPLLQAAEQAEPKGYRQAVDEAVREFAARNFEEARSLFARADTLFPNARTQRGLGLAEFELRNYIECIQHLRAALECSVKPLDASLRSQTEQLLARAESFIGHFLLATKPEAAGISIDGFVSPMPVDHTVTLQVGDHYLELYADDYTAEKRLLNVKGGESELLRIDFTRPAAATPTRAPVDTMRWYGNPWLWVTVGIVLAGAATGVVFASSSRTRTNTGSAGTLGP